MNWDDQIKLKQKFKEKGESIYISLTANHLQFDTWWKSQFSVYDSRTRGQVSLSSSTCRGSAFGWCEYTNTLISYCVQNTYIVTHIIWLSHYIWRDWMARAIQCIFIPFVISQKSINWNLEFVNWIFVFDFSFFVEQNKIVWRWTIVRWISIILFVAMIWMQYLFQVQFKIQRPFFWFSLWEFIKTESKAVVHRHTILHLFLDS